MADNRHASSPQADDLFKYWTYFKIIEKDFQKLSEIIEIDENHFEVYSRELVKLLVVTCSEVDTICRVLRDIKEPSSGDGRLSIEDHWAFLDENHNFVFDECMDVSLAGISLKPFESWTRQNPPPWWSGYNKVKHHRIADYKSANLGHCLNAGAALTILLLTAQSCISKYQLPMDPDIRLEFFGIPYNFDNVVSSPGANFGPQSKTYMATD